MNVACKRTITVHVWKSDTLWPLIYLYTLTQIQLFAVEGERIQKVAFTGLPTSRHRSLDFVKGLKNSEFKNMEIGYQPCKWRYIKEWLS